MKKTSTGEYPVMSVELQLDFAQRLDTIRCQFLAESLSSTLDRLEIRDLDLELMTFADSRSLKKLAKSGLRGEIVFPTPLLLVAQPRLLGYYRLLYGISQKEFYQKGPFQRFSRMESEGVLTELMEPRLPNLCRSLGQTASLLVDGLNKISLGLIHELQLLTLGPQFRGGRNNTIGGDATKDVVRLLMAIAGKSIIDRQRNLFRLKNAAGRIMVVEFASDPDVLVREFSSHGTERLVLSMEVKGGSDASNIHNRLGEAEKSHLKIKDRECSERWTVLRVELDSRIARKASPSTTRFFHLDKILSGDTEEGQQFRTLFRAHLGLKDS